MKNVYWIIVLVLIFSFLLIPLLSVEHSEGSLNNSAESKTAESQTVRVKNSTTNEIESIDKSEYLLGVLAAEILPNTPDEFIKAMAVTANTFTEYRLAQNKNQNYDITNDPNTDQGYLTGTERKEKWGDKTAEYEEKFSADIKAVAGQILTYQNQPIMAVYHAISSGKTESAENVWGTALPYLVSRNSDQDLLSQDYLSQLTLSPADFAAKLSQNGATPDEDITKYITAPKKSKVGTVLTQTLCNKQFTGSEIRKIFGLRSSNFELTLQNEQFVFTVKGYGHGVGLSQNGAQYLAEQGEDYTGILNAYYTDCKIENK